MKKGQRPSGVNMKEHFEKGNNGRLNNKETAEDSCRCKEVSKKTVPEMLKLMMSDLAFWKKSGKRR